MLGATGGISAQERNYSLNEPEKQYGTGLLPETEEPIYVEPPAIAAFSALPTSVDLSAEKYFPPIGNQGWYNSCAAWAVTYYQFTYAAARLNDWDVKGVDNNRIASPRWTHNFMQSGNDGGSMMSGNYYVLQEAGAVKNSEFAFPSAYTTAGYRVWCTDVDAIRNALNTRVSDYSYEAFSISSTATPITGPNSAGLTNIKTLLNEGNVLAFETDIYGWDIVNTSNGAVCIKAVDANSPHPMVIVGYDNNFSYDLNGNGIIDTYERGAFKVANSWGASWNNDGYV